MTLIVGTVWGPWAFHASDRLISLKAKSGSTNAEWDPNSNKTIIVIGSDCWLVIGYTGLAYLNGKPTDQYLAECITGIDDLTGSAIFMWLPDRLIHYREIRNRIAAGLESAYQKLPQGVRQIKTAVLASGLQRARRRHDKRVTFRVDMQGDSASSIELVPRVLPFAGFNLSAVGFCDSSIMNALYDVLGAYRDSVSRSYTLPDPTPFRDLMMQAVRGTGTTAPDSVGQHAVGVILNPLEKKITSVFSPADPTGEPTAKFDVPQNFSDLPKIPTPWVLKPGMCFGPSVASQGGWVDPQSGLSFEFSGFGDQPPGPGGGYFGAAPRKGPPR